MTTSTNPAKGLRAVHGIGRIVHADGMAVMVMVTMMIMMMMLMMMVAMMMATRKMTKVQDFVEDYHGECSYYDRGWNDVMRTRLKMPTTTSTNSACISRRFEYRCETKPQRQFPGVPPTTMTDDYHSDHDYNYEQRQEQRHKQHPHGKKHGCLSASGSVNICNAL